MCKITCHCYYLVLVNYLSVFQNYFFSASDVLRLGFVLQQLANVHLLCVMDEDRHTRWVQLNHIFFLPQSEGRR